MHVYMQHSTRILIPAVSYCTTLHSLHHCIKPQRKMISRVLFVVSALLMAQVCFLHRFRINLPNWLASRLTCAAVAVARVLTVPPNVPALYLAECLCW